MGRKINNVGVFCFSLLVHRENFVDLTSMFVTFSILPLLVAQYRFVNLPQQSLLVVPHVGSGRLQQEVDPLPAEQQLADGELLHPGFELLRIWTGRKTMGQQSVA